jgi:hypothetical protein
MFLDFRSLYERAAAGTSYVLSVLTGLFTGEESDAQLTKTSDLAVTSETFAADGSDVSLRKLSVLEVLPSAFAFVGSDVVLVYTPEDASHRVLTIQSGTFVFTGSPANLLHEEAGGGGLDWSSFVPKKKKSQVLSYRRTINHYTMSVRPASFQSAAPPVLLSLHRVTSAHSGQFQFETGGATLRISRAMRIEPADFASQSAPVALRVSRRLQPETGVFIASESMTQYLVDSSMLLALLAEDEEWILLNVAC